MYVSKYVLYFILIKEHSQDPLQLQLIVLLLLLFSVLIVPTIIVDIIDVQ